MRKAVLVIPTYNEAGNIENLVDRIFKITEKIDNWEIHIVIVDSHSQDGSKDIINRLQKKHRLLHLLETAKEGLGKAYVNGFRYAIDKINPYLIFEMDADLSHDPEKIPVFLKEIESGADFVIGSRYIKNGSIPQDWGLHRKIFSIIANLSIRLGFMNLKVTDWTSGFRAIKVWIIKEALPHLSNYTGYVFQVALLDFALNKNSRIKEVPINFRDRKIGVSKIDPAQYIFHIIKYVFFHSSFIKFFIVGTFGFVIDFGLSTLLVDKFNQSIQISNVISGEAAIISNFLFNNFWSFRHKMIDAKLKNYLISFLKFNLTSIGAMLIQIVGITILVGIFGRNYWQIYKVALVVFIVIPYSYFFYNKFIWKKK